MSQTKDKATQTAVETLVSGGIKELIVREGKAQEVFSPRIVVITGILDSPLRWLQKRIAVIDQLAANIMVDREKMSITYTEKELDHFANVITGSLELHPVFNRFNIIA